jgi:CsoR family transcriptional regulator, copper-sensing transcriptional repressor
VGRRRRCQLLRQFVVLVAADSDNTRNQAFLEGEMSGTTVGPATRDKVIKRLQRLEGQVRGVARMIEDGRDCEDILTQLAAIRGASHRISVIVVHDYAKNCLVNLDTEENPDELVAKMVQALGQLPH